MPAKTDRPSSFKLGKIQLIDWLLLAVPTAFLIRFVPAWYNESLLFFISGLAIIPLARWMGLATENLGERTGPAVSGLLNATFSNAPEFIIALVALSKGLIGVVKASLIGSIIGNILFVLGIAMLTAGMRFRHLRFNQTGVRVAATSLSLAAIGLVIPSIFHRAVQQQGSRWSPLAERNLSVAIAVVLLITYGFWLTFSLVTHKELFAGQKAASRESGPEKPAAWSLTKGVLILAVATILVVMLSELLAGSVESVCKNLGLSETFVGVIIVSIIGNAGESTAVWAALKNKMDLSLSIVIGSSLQIALLVTPLLVLVSHFIGHPMTLEFSLPEIASLVLAVGTVVLICSDGECNWLEGAQLLSVYLIIVVLFYFLPEPLPL